MHSRTYMHTRPLLPHKGGLLELIESAAVGLCGGAVACVYLASRIHPTVLPPASIFHAYEDATDRPSPTSSPTVSPTTSSTVSGLLTRASPAVLASMHSDAKATGAGGDGHGPPGAGVQAPRVGEVVVFARTHPGSVEVRVVATGYPVACKVPPSHIKATDIGSDGGSGDGSGDGRGDGRGDGDGTRAGGRGENLSHFWTTKANTLGVVAGSNGSGGVDGGGALLMVPMASSPTSLWRGGVVGCIGVARLGADCLPFTESDAAALTAVAHAAVAKLERQRIIHSLRLSDGAR